jgi:hypothetical protein
MYKSVSSIVGEDPGMGYRILPYGGIRFNMIISRKERMKGMRRRRIEDVPYSRTPVIAEK